MFTLEWKDFECEFAGEIVRAKVRPFKRGAAIKIIPYLQRGEGEGKSPIAMVLESLDLQSLVPELFPEHVKDISLMIDGHPVTLDQLSDESVLTPLVSRIMTMLLNISFFTKQDEKNSDGPSGA